ncbi:nucleotide exchange factor GrpE [Candidatus Woesearchaeota archaeon]|nr:nucleotide exchange factor GrpE [Candidatus Woesearchaeota archaeon]
MTKETRSEAKKEEQTVKAEVNNKETKAQIETNYQESTVKAEVKKEELSALELKELLQRTQANFENYRKQAEKRIMEIKEMASRNIILQLLPVLDHFELAFKNNDHLGKAFQEGIELIYVQLNTLLENHEVKAIECLDQKFDPYLHEALLKVESEQPEGMILEEFQKGFTLHGEVIRHAKVKISSGKKTEETRQNQNNQNHQRPDKNNLNKNDLKED